MGIAALVYMGWRHVMHKSRVNAPDYDDYNNNDWDQDQRWDERPHHQRRGGDDHPRRHRLGASAESSNDETMKQTFSWMSVAIWGLVASKAKTGQDAVASSDSSTVAGLVKKIGTMCCLIAAASVMQYMSTMNDAPEAEHVTKSSKKLKSSHTDSFNDPSSSHYQGGAHNILMQYAKDKMSGKIKGNAYDKKTKTNEPAHESLMNYAKGRMSGEIKQTKRTALKMTSESMGGAHNVAMAVLQEQSNEFRRKQAARKNKVQSSRPSFSQLFGGAARQPSQKELHANMKETGKFVAFMATIALCVAYYVTMKTYHAQLAKADQMQALLKNPNARVAAGAKGKEIAKKIRSKKEESMKEESVKKEVKPKKSGNKLDDLIAKAKAKKALKSAETEILAEKLLSGYEAPRMEPAPQAAPVTTYQLIEQPVAAPQPVAVATQGPYFYPQNFEVSAPLPVPQVISQPVPKVVIAQPEPMREPLPQKPAGDRKELIKALLMQLAKENDLEQQ